VNGNSISFVLRWGLSKEISGFGDMVSHFVHCDCSSDSLKRTECFTGGNGHLEPHGTATRPSFIDSVLLVAVERHQFDLFG